MKTIKYVLFIALLLFFSCEEQSLSPDTEKDSDMSKGMMKISLDMTDAPFEVVGLEGKLYNNHGYEINFDFDISNNAATAFVEDVPSGAWTLKVDAHNKDGVIIYTGTTEVTIYPGVVTPVSIHLDLAIGSLEITVTWEKINKIAYQNSGQIYMINILGHNKVNLTQNSRNNSFPVFSPDGSKIAFWSNKEVYIMNNDGSHQMNLTNNPVNFSPSAWEPFVFSPDGSKIVFISDKDGNYEIYLMNSNGSGQINLTNHPGYDVFPSFTPDGSKIVFRSNRDGDDEIYIMNTDGSGLINLTNNQIDDMRPIVSPDGFKIAYTINLESIWIMNIDGSGKTRLSYGSYPVFSPDGSKIAYTHIAGSTQIYIMNIDGSNQIKLTSSSQGNDEPVFSPDGAKIAFRKDIEGGVYIYIMNVDGTDQKRLVGPNSFLPAFQPEF